jgi:hypothetical protein
LAFDRNRRSRSNGVPAGANTQFTATPSSGHPFSGPASTDLKAPDVNDKFLVSWLRNEDLEELLALIFKVVAENPTRYTHFRRLGWSKILDG